MGILLPCIIHTCGLQLRSGLLPQSVKHLRALVGCLGTGGEVVERLHLLWREVAGGRVRGTIDDGLYGSILLGIGFLFLTRANDVECLLVEVPVGSGHLFESGETVLDSCGLVD